jgi:hypothetical protein
MKENQQNLLSVADFNNFMLSQIKISKYQKNQEGYLKF